MSRRLSGILLVGLLVGACGSAGPTAAPAATVVATPTTAPTPTIAPTPTATPAATASAANPFAGQPFTLDLPAGWQAFDLKDPAGKAAIDEVIKNNPQFAGAIAAFQSLPNVVFSVNPVLGNVMIALSLPTGGATLDQLKTGFDAQFSAVPGIVGKPEATDVTLPAGKGLHYDLKLSVNGANGQKVTVAESLYIVVNGPNLVLVEFVAPGGAPIAQEQQIVQSLKFVP